MEEVNSKVIMKRNLPKGKVAISKIDMKPVQLFYAIIGMGFVFLGFGTYLIGIPLIIFSAYNLFFTKAEPVVEFYDEYVLFKNDRFQEEYYLVFYREILAWKYFQNKKAMDEVEITLQNHQRLIFTSYDKGKMVRLMRSFAPNNPEIVQKDIVKVK
ncbi:MAG: hypothetical protein ACRDBX_08540 [Erysipelotrichaceae bacterium]